MSRVEAGSARDVGDVEDVRDPPVTHHGRTGNGAHPAEQCSEWFHDDLSGVSDLRDDEPDAHLAVGDDDHAQCVCIFFGVLI